MRKNGAINDSIFLREISRFWVYRRYRAGARDNKNMFLVMMARARNVPDEKYFLLLKK